MLLSNQRVRGGLTDGQIVELMVDIDERSEAAGWPYTPRPDEGFAASPAFSGDESTEGALRAGYAGLTDLVWGRLPTFDEAVDIIRDNSDLI